MPFRIRINPLAIVGGLMFLGIILAIPGFQALEKPRAPVSSHILPEKAGF